MREFVTKREGKRGFRAVRPVKEREKRKLPVISHYTLQSLFQGELLNAANRKFSEIIDTLSQEHGPIYNYHKSECMRRNGTPGRPQKPTHTRAEGGGGWGGRGGGVGNKCGLGVGSHHVETNRKKKTIQNKL